MNFEMEDDPVDLSYHKMQERNGSVMMKKKMLIINVLQSYIRSPLP